MCLFTIYSDYKHEENTKTKLKVTTLYLIFRMMYPVYIYTKDLHVHNDSPLGVTRT